MAVRQAFECITDYMETSALDDRSYRVICLPNKLEALLVHEPGTDKASAALDVNVGNFSDKEDMPGVAHAVEHMLFMGTKKASVYCAANFPEENDFSQFLTRHSGLYNAYTASTSTNFHLEIAAFPGTAGSAEEFVISPSHPSGDEAQKSPLYGALDRFAQFFIDPLFLSSTLNRELKAVDSENKKNLRSDTWRLTQLSKSLSNSDHPYCHFSTGNYETLHDGPMSRGVKIRNELIDFYNKNYSANRMKLVVLGRESLDKLQSWVVELFSEVRNKDLSQNRWDREQLWTEKELLTQYFAKPLMDMRRLDIIFPFLDEENYYDSHPGRYLSHLIGHQGPGSIFALTKAKGWADNLSAYNSPICPGSAVFRIEVSLTEDGLKNYTEIVKTVFQYIALLQKTPPQLRIVQEMMKMGEINFRFKQKSPARVFTRVTSSIMQGPVPRKQLLAGSWLIRKFDPEAIAKALGYLRPDNFRMAIISQNLERLNQKEKWYGTEYRCEKIPRDFLVEIQCAGRVMLDLYLPAENNFIPTKLEVEKKEVKEPSKAPHLIQNNDSVRVWWKKDDQFQVPRSNVHLTLRNPLANTTPKNVVMTRLYCELVMDALVEYFYNVKAAGLNYSLRDHKDGLGVEVSGYNDKLPLLLKRIVTSMRDLNFTPDRFKVVKERLTRDYQNWGVQPPYLQIKEYSRWLNVENCWNNEQLLTELEHVDEYNIRNFYPQLLQQMHIEALAHGNLNRDNALGLIQLAKNTFKPRPLPRSLWSIHRSLTIPSGSNYLLIKMLNDPVNVNHCIDYYLFVGEYADRMLRAKLMLFAEITFEPFFDQLRTKEQLGYVVSSGVRTHLTTIGYGAFVQSGRTTEYLETRIDAFLEGFGARLEEMNNDVFETHKRSLINRRQEKLNNLDEETQRFWGHISNESFDFEQVDHDVASLTSLSKENLVEFYMIYIRPSSLNRAKTAVHMIAQSSVATSAVAVSPEWSYVAEGQNVPALGIQQQLEGKNGNGPGKLARTIQNVQEFKASLTASAGAKPVRDLSEFKENSEI